MSIVFMVLKIVGIIILILLALILLLVVTILLSPIKYKASFEKYDDINLYGNITWLFKLIKITASYEKNILSYKVQALGKIFLSSDDEEKEESFEVENPSETEQAENSTAKEVIFSTEENKEDIYKKIVEEPKQPEQKKEEQEEQKPDFEEYKKSHTKAVVRRVKIKDIDESLNLEKEKTENIDDIKENEEENQQKINKEYFIKLPFNEKKYIIGCCTKFIKRILKGVLPKDFYLDINIGTSNPSTTGYILATAGIIKGTMFENLNVNANFEKAVFEGKGSLAGKITIGYLLYSILRFILEKPIRKILVLYLKDRGVENE